MPVKEKNYYKTAYIEWHSENRFFHFCVFQCRYNACNQNE